MSELDSGSKRKFGTRQLLRIVMALVALAGCYYMTVDAGKSGASRLMSVTAAVSSGLQFADLAVKLTPRDPQAHYARALVLINSQRLEEAIAELRQAIQLRPYHYYEWLDLGVTLDRIGDEAGAETALRRSVELAPFFAQPRWQLGNLLFRQGHYEEAFAELRRGAETNSSLVPGLLNFAWVASDGDAQKIELWVQPKSTRRHLELGAFFAHRHDGPAAVRELRAAGEPQNDDDLTLINQTVLTLLDAKLYSDAYGAWAAGPNRGVDPKATGVDQLLNGDFVKPVRRNEPGFGWQIGGVSKFTASIDTAGPAPGANSLRLEFEGETPPGNPLASQLVMVRPKTRYSLSFMARAQDLLTGGPPVVLVYDAGNPLKTLGQSKALAPGTKDWNLYQVDFTTEDKMEAVIISIQRLACGGVCPVVGNLWLSKFSLSRS